MSALEEAPAGGVQPGSALFWRTNVALFLAGFASFSLLYCVQPLLPLFVQAFGVGAAASSLALSLATGALAVAIFGAGAWSDGRDKRGLMMGSMVLAAICNLVASQSPSWHGLLAARLVAGLVLGGVPAVAMAYLAERMSPQALGRSVGLYVAGTAFGGMTGRIGTSLAAEAWGWQAAMAGLSVLDLAAALGFAWLLPKGAAPKAGAPRAERRSAVAHVHIWRAHLRHPALPWLFLTAFLGVGAFVAIFNYVGFLLMAHPFGWRTAEIGWVFGAYVFAMAASPLAGALADRVGPLPVISAGVAMAALGVSFTLSAQAWAVVTGIVGLTAGFFAVHAVASSWVGRLGGAHKGHATSLYLLAYYLGSSVLGSWGGHWWEWAAWPGVAGMALVALAGVAACAWRLGLAAPRLRAATAV
ncbi:MAG: hypothetical protein RI907_997 [Pseudomonadota bacterium]|jgi:YNFM family putative membrane transporter